MRRDLLPVGPRARARRRAIAGVVVTLALLVLSAGLGHAAGTVTDCTTYGPGAGTLATALVGGGTVTFACSGTILVPQITPSASTLIDGNGYPVTLTGGYTNRVLWVGPDVTVELRGITVTGGRAAGESGGGIGNLGALTLTGTTVSGNEASFLGGGVASVGRLTLANSTVSGNVAGAGGGGLANLSAFELTLISSTVSANAGGAGAGGILNYGLLSLMSSIVAEQGQGADCDSAIGTVTSQGYNLDSDGTCGLTAAGDIPQGNGDLLALAVTPPGTTATHALGAASQARDAIPLGASGCGTTTTTDQRGVSRPQNGRCEMGAFEEEVVVDGDGDGVLDDVDVCPGTVLPDPVPSARLGVNRFAVNAQGAFVTTAPKGRGPQKAFTIQDTAGCSCVQIIAALGLGEGHTKFGCSLGAMEDWISRLAR